MFRPFIRRVLRGLGYEVRTIRTPPRGTVGAFLQRHAIDLVIDVGANIGQFARSVRGDGYAGRIVSFEPVPESFTTLAATAGSDPKWEVHALALGAVNATTEIAVTRFSLLSSFLPQSGYCASFGAGAEVVGTQTVEMARLDDVLPRQEGQRIFLKVDTEGYEKQVLDGAPRIMAEATGVMLEVPIIALYRGCWSFPDALAYMATRGFAPSQIHSLAYDRVDGSLLTVDCVFRRRDSRDDPTPQCDQVN